DRGEDVGDRLRAGVAERASLEVADLAIPVSSLRVAQTMSATETTPAWTMVSGTPCWIAEIAAGSATSPYGMSDASALRTVVPPPADVMKPVTSSPASDLNQAFSRATANGTPYIPTPKWVTVRSTATAAPAPAKASAKVAARSSVVAGME